MGPESSGRLRSEPSLNFSFLALPSCSSPGISQPLGLWLFSYFGSSQCLRHAGKVSAPSSPDGPGVSGDEVAKDEGQEVEAAFLSGELGCVGRQSLKPRGSPWQEERESLWEAPGQVPQESPEGWGLCLPFTCFPCGSDRHVECAVVTPGVEAS